ncbi:hypothetical protein EV132_109134 [Rhizobium sullae]|uniref:Uncharacterized protein n=1 Tax=Rhizobium sullae TaxID=50338 RepID=A0A4R3Q0J9_RHISU|nr:hypothetical protein EV132_109134 [Rhizobium sullae]
MFRIFRSSRTAAPKRRAMRVVVRCCQCSRWRAAFAAIRAAWRLALAWRFNGCCARGGPLPLLVAVVEVGRRHRVHLAGGER